MSFIHIIPSIKNVKWPQKVWFWDYYHPLHGSLNLKIVLYISHVSLYVAVFVVWTQCQHETHKTDVFESKTKPVWMVQYRTNSLWSDFTYSILSAHNFIKTTIWLCNKITLGRRLRLGSVWKRNIEPFFRTLSSFNLDQIKQTAYQQFQDCFL